MKIKIIYEADQIEDIRYILDAQKNEALIHDIDNKLRKYLKYHELSEETYAILENVRSLIIEN